MEEEERERERDSKARMKAALEWVKNCCGMADFYLALQHYQCCAFALGRLLTFANRLSPRVVFFRGRWEEFQGDDPRVQAFAFENQNRQPLWRSRRKIVILLVVYIT